MSFEMGGKYRNKALLAGTSISPMRRVSKRHPHNQNEQPTGVEWELAMSLCNFSTKPLLFSFRPHCSMSHMTWTWMKIGRHLVLKHIICKDHAAVFSVGSSSSCTAEINAHCTPEQQVKQNIVSISNYM